LRISRLDGRVTLTMPPHAPAREGVAFLEAREDWLRGHLGQIAPVIPVQIGGTVMYQGQVIPIAQDLHAPARLSDDRIVLRAADRPGPRVRALLKADARDKLASASDEFAATLGRAYSRLKLRDTRSRWGSCSSQGALMYSWRLIMAPPEVLRYVAAHEVAHLVEMNHSPAFWAVVARLMPDYPAYRNWLRDNGDQLYRVDFGD
jgi:predicted metal-dependent hydrolase